MNQAHQTSAWRDVQNTPELPMFPELPSGLTDFEYEYDLALDLDRIVTHHNRRHVQFARMTRRVMRVFLFGWQS